MFSRRFARFLSIFVMCTVLVQQQAQAQALPVATRVGTAIAGAIEQTLIRRGFAANDPRFQATLNAVGVAANDAVFNVAGTAGMVVAGVAGLPAWGTVAIGLGVGALAFGAYKMLTSPVTQTNPETGQPVIDPVSGQPVQSYAVAPASMSIPEIQAAAANPAPSMADPAPYVASPSVPTGLGGQHYRVGTFNCSAGDMPCAALAALPLLPASVRFFVPQSDGSAVPIMSVGDWINNTNNFASNILCRPGSEYSNCQVNWDIAPGFDTASQWFVGHWYISYLYTPNGGTAMPYTVPMESAGSSNSPYGAYPGSYGINPAYVTPPQTAQTLDQLLSKLSPEQLASPVSTQSIADIATKAWQQVAPDPTVFPATDPVTAQDVQNYLNSHPGSQPTMNDALAPITGLVTVPAPSTNPNPNPNPDPNPTPTDTFMPPGLEAIPTAAQILAPILGLLPDFKNYVVPAHQAVCPAPSMEFFGKQLVLDAHCTLLDNQNVRQTIYMVMAAVWMALAVFIILGA